MTTESQSTSVRIDRYVVQAERQTATDSRRIRPGLSGADHGRPRSGGPDPACWAASLLGDWAAGRPNRLAIRRQQMRERSAGRRVLTEPYIYPIACGRSSDGKPCEQPHHSPIRGPPDPECSHPRSNRPHWPCLAGTPRRVTPMSWRNDRRPAGIASIYGKRRTRTAAAGLPWVPYAWRSAFGRS
jgi:hypothetical protein